MKQEQIDFLQKLNNKLNEIEQQIIERVTVCLKRMEKSKNANTFTTDYEVEAKVQYYIERRHNSIHTYY